jgi:hypothetical protein
MIFSLCANYDDSSKSRGFFIALDSDVATFNANNSYTIESKGNFTKYDSTFQRITKEYRNVSGNVITYGVRSRYKTISFTIECLQNDYNYIMEVLKDSYEYRVTENYPNTPMFMRLSGDLKESKICNNYHNSKALYTISGTLVEV